MTTELCAGTLVIGLAENVASFQIGTLDILAGGLVFLVAVESNLCSAAVD